jgi:hypothetical protein
VLKTKYVAGLDKNRAKAQDPMIINHWFDLFKTTRSKYNVKDENISNMDEKGVMLGIISKTKVIVSRHEKKQYMTEPGNREWVSLIECIPLKPSCQRPRPWFIFKGKQHQKQWFSAYKDAHIALSDKGWTDNELGYEWISRCYEPQTRPDNENEWRMLIVDGHASHVTTKAIKFCLNHKIVLLCLPPHTTHILQPLDVGIFAALAALYKKGVRERSRFLINYSIDKVDFLEIYKIARAGAITESNISKAWKAVGLDPFEPDVVLKQLPGQTLVSLRPTTPPAIVNLTLDGNAAQTPGNVAQIEDLFNHIIKDEPQLDPATLLKLKKLLKGATKAMTNAKIQHTTNAELIAAKEVKKRRGKRSKENYGFARVLDAELIQERENETKEKKFDAAWKELNRIKPTASKAKKKKKKGSPLKGSLLKGSLAKSRSHQATNQLIEQLSPAVLRFLQPESTSPVKATSAVKSVGIDKPSKKRLKANKGGSKGSDTQANAQANVQANGGPDAEANAQIRSARQVKDQEDKAGQVIQTRSGRVLVRKVRFEAGKN